MGTISYNIVDMDLGQYDHFFKLDVDIIDDDLYPTNLINKNGLGYVTIKVRLTTETTIPMTQNKQLQFSYFFGNEFKNINTYFIIDGSHIYNNEVVYTEKVDAYYGRDRHCSTNGIFNFYIEEWCSCIDTSTIQGQTLKDYFLTVGDQHINYNYISPLDCRKRRLYSGVTSQPYLTYGENGNSMASYGSDGINGTDYFTVDMCIFEKACNLRTWNLDTNNYQYELCWTLKYPNTIYDNDRNILISKGNVVNGDNTFSIYPTQTYPNYTWNTSTYRENISLFLRKYEGNTLISETREIMIFSLTSLYNINDITFYDNNHDENSWLANRDTTTYNNYCNTFNENRDFIANISEFVLNCHVTLRNFRDQLTKATLYTDNKTIEQNFSSGTVMSTLSLNSQNCDFDFMQDLETFFLPERMIKRYRLDLTLKSPSNTTVTQSFYGYFPVIPHYNGICDVVDIYKCDEYGVRLSQDQNLQNNYFKIVYNVDCFANDLFNENINTNDPPVFDIKVNELPSGTLTDYYQNSYTSNKGTKYFESRGHAYIILPFTLYREYLYTLRFETPFLNYREYKNSFSSKKPIMNFKSTGNSMAIGKISENENYLEVGYDIMTTNDNYTLGLRSDNEKLIRMYNNSFSTELNPQEYQKTYDKYTDSQNVERYPHATTLSVGDSTKSDEFRIIDELRGRPIIKYTSQDNHSTDNTDTHSDAKAKYNHLAFGCGLIFNNQGTGQYDNGLIKDRYTTDYYRFQNGARAYNGTSALGIIFSPDSTNVSYIDSGVCIKWGCIVQFYVTVKLNITIPSGDTPDKKLLNIKLPNFRPLISSGACGGDWGAMSNGQVRTDGGVWISGASAQMNSGSLCTISAMYFTRFDESTDTYFEDCNW